MIFITTNKLSHMIITVNTVHHLQCFLTGLANLDLFLSSDRYTCFSRTKLVKFFFSELDGVTYPVYEKLCLKLTQKK